MKILHLANFYHETSGGIRTYLDSKRAYLNERGLPFRMVIPGDTDGIQIDGTDIIYRISSSQAPLNDAYRMIWDFMAVYSIIRREKPDLLEVNDKWTLAGLSLLYRMFKKNRPPMVGFHHERLDQNIAIYLNNPNHVKIPYSWLMNMFCKGFDRILCNSRFTAGEIEPFAPEKIKVLSLGTDTTHFNPKNTDAELRRELLGDRELLLLYVGRLNREKNLELLPEMMRLLEQRGVSARLVVAGAGQDSHLLTDAGRDDITMLGFISDRDKVAQLMASADMFIFPSVTEPFGLVSLEALASGCPVVCSDKGGVLEYADSKAVRSIHPTPENYADSVIDVYRQDQKEIRTIARIHAEHFSWDNTFDRQMAFYRQLIEDRLK